MLAEIISIGDEILIGQVVDTNSNWIATELTKIGFQIRKISAIPDDRDSILEALNEAFAKSKLIITTGGLGPTSDDLTKPLLVDYFKSKLVTNQEVYVHISQLLEKRNIAAKELNLKQAEIPEVCKVLFNKVGTAPGMWFEKNNAVLISLPGVPFEMKSIIENEALPLIKEKFKTPERFQKTIMTFGLPESVLSERIAPWEKQLPQDIKLAYLPSPEGIRLRLSLTGSNLCLIKSTIQLEIEKLQNYISDYIYGYDDNYLHQVVFQLLKEQKKTVSTAESCTGGYLAHLITSIPGSSECYKGSIVAYANEIKVDVLNVSNSNIEMYGAVSKSVVEQMATQVMKKMKTDFGVATSGIAGPNGATNGKPVGTIWIAVASEKKVFSKKFVFGDLRDINIRRSSNAALNLLRLMILEKTALLSDGLL